MEEIPDHAAGFLLEDVDIPGSPAALPRQALWQRLQQPATLEVLETGCGAGRFTEVLLSLPGVSLTSTDLSAAVEPNQLNCPQSARHRIIQCDINALPFRPRQYDVVVCLGVVQHTQKSRANDSQPV